MRDESMDIEEGDMSVDTLVERPLWRVAPTMNISCGGIKTLQAVTMDDERTNYTAPNVTLLTVKEALTVWSKEDRQELYTYLNRVYQVRMR